MVKILKSDIVLFFIFIFVNLFLIDIQPVFLLEAYSYEKTGSVNKLLDIFAWIVLLNRFYLLPLYLYIMSKYSQNIKVKEIIKTFYNSNKIKTFALLVIFVLSICWGVVFSTILYRDFSIFSFKNLIMTATIFAPIIGLYQAYLIMYFYWWINKKFNIVENTSSLLPIGICMILDCKCLVI